MPIKVTRRCMLAVFFSLLLGHLSTPHALTMPPYKRLNPMLINLKSPIAVSVGPDDRVYVVDTALNRLNIYEPDGRFIKGLPNLEEPISVAVDGSGRIFIGNSGKGDVEVYDTDLSFMFKLGRGDGEFKRPCSIAVDATGNIYVSDCKDDKIKVYHPDGSFNYSFGSSGSGNGQFSFPSSITIDDVKSEIIVTDFPLLSDYRGARIQVFNMSGGFKRGFQKRSCGMLGCNVGEGILVRPLGIAVDRDSRIYVSDSYQGVVEVFDAGSGTYLGTIYNMTYPFIIPIGIAFKNNRLYISSQGNSRVESYTTDTSTPDITTDYSSHDYGVVDVGDSSDVFYLQISNIGGGDLIISNVTISDSEDFHIDSDTCTGKTLESLDSCMIGVVFSPTSGGQKEAILGILSNDPDENPFEIQLSGMGNVANSIPVSVPGGPYHGVEGQAILLDGSGSYDVDGNITLYEWDIDNDGVYDYSSTAPTQSHTYTQNGVYTISLRVTDNIGATGEQTTTVTIEDTAPVADFIASQTSGMAPLTVDFINNSSGYDQPLSYEWDFNNDGVIDSYEINPSYTYTTAGQYTVSLKVSDADGSSNTLTRVDYINVTPSSYLLAIRVNGKGVVTSSPAGITCGPSNNDCDEIYPAGSTIRLEANPDSGWLFEGWDGDCTGDTLICDVTIDTEKSVFAKFVFIETYNWEEVSGLWRIERMKDTGELVYGAMNSLSRPAYSLTDVDNSSGMSIETRASMQGGGRMQGGRIATYIVFAYDDVTGLAYVAGPDASDGDRWIIGSVNLTNNALTLLASSSETIERGRWYEIKVMIGEDTVRLYADDVEKTNYTFTGGIPAGKIGIGGYGHPRFDNLKIGY